MSNPLNVMVMSPQKMIFQGGAESVTSENAKGVFDVLSTHANFISLIKNTLIIRNAERTVTIPVTDGVLRVYQNSVMVFLGLVGTGAKKQ